MSLLRRPRGKYTRETHKPNFSGDQLVLITVVIVTIEFLFRLAAILGIAPNNVRCTLPSEYWFDSDPPLFLTFAVTFLSLLLWNFAEFIRLLRSRLTSGTNTAIFCANTVALILTGFMLNNLYSHVVGYESVYRFADDAWNATDKGHPWRVNACQMSKQYLGEWEVRISPSADVAGLVDGAVLHLKRDFTFRVYGADGEQFFKGRWKAPIYIESAAVKPAAPYYWDDVFWLDYRDAPFESTQLCVESVGKHMIIMRALKWDGRVAEYYDTESRITLIGMKSETSYIRTDR